MGKHAFLIMAHNDLPLLNNLIRCLDYPGNSLFIHIDAKSAMKPDSVFKPCNADIIFTDRINVSWGGDSQIRAELVLMKAAVRTGTYDYYHLISGQDLPLKSMAEFHDFFRKNAGKSYMEFDLSYKHEQFVSRIGKYHLFQNRIGRNIGPSAAFFHTLQTPLVTLQRIFGIDRTKKCPYKLYKGANWFSITDDMVKYALSKEQDIIKYFFNGFCADEIFLHTILKNSPYADTIVNNCLREIDWNRGSQYYKWSPYTYTIEDLDMLLASPNLFARKFSSETDLAIIKEICNINGVAYQ